MTSTSPLSALTPTLWAERPREAVPLPPPDRFPTAWPLPALFLGIFYGAKRYSECPVGACGPPAGSGRGAGSP